MALANNAHSQPAECQTGIDSFEKKQFMVAVTSLTKCLEYKLPPAPRAFVLQMRAQAQLELKQPERALEDQKASLAIEKPKNVWPLVMLAVYNRELNRFDDALAALKEALNLDEDGPGTGPGMAVYYHTGQTLHKAGRYKEAVEAYTRGIPKQPDYGYALFHRALAYEAMGDRVQAKRDLFRAAELAPKEGYESELIPKFKEYGFTVKERGN